MKKVLVVSSINGIAGRNGLGLSHALENRIIGTKSRGVYIPAIPPTGCCPRRSGAAWTASS